MKVKAILVALALVAATSVVFAQENNTAKNNNPRKTSFVDNNKNGICDKSEDGTCSKGKQACGGEACKQGNKQGKGNCDGSGRGGKCGNGACNRSETPKK